jgi:hypothetical protein
MPIRLPLMAALIELVTNSVLRRRQPRAHPHVAVLRDRLVGFLRRGGAAGLAGVFRGFEGVSVGEGLVGVGGERWEEGGDGVAVGVEEGGHGGNREGGGRGVGGRTYLMVSILSD